MRNALVAFFLAVVWCQYAVHAQTSKESAAIYKEFLASYDNGSHTTLNIADRTEVFRPSFTPASATSCLEEVHIEAIPGTETHTLDVSILPIGLKAKFISAKDAKNSRRDPGDAIKHGKAVEDAVKEGFAAGVLTLSEIVFNANQTRAVLSYSFICGSLCGSGGAYLFEKHDDKWIQSRQVCGQWISQYKKERRHVSLQDTSAKDGD